MFNSDERLRGPSPSSFEIFFRSALTSNQAALFVCICRIVGAGKSPNSLEDGEKMCEAFEIFREWEPDARLEFEQAVLLLVGSEEAERIELVSCSGCRVAILCDKLGDSRRTCRRCTSSIARTKAASPLPSPRSGARRREQS
jgi:hypothetical protein